MTRNTQLTNTKRKTTFFTVFVTIIYLKWEKVAKTPHRLTCSSGFWSSCKEKETSQEE